MIIDLPARTQKNGTLTAFVVLTKIKNLKAEVSTKFQLTGNSYSIVKELPLTRYKVNSTGKFVNLLDSPRADRSTTTGKDGKKQVKENKEPKITHMLSRVTVYTMDSQIDFDRYHIPDELYHDMM